MVEGISIRPATIDDVADLVRLRREMFEAVGFDDPAELAASCFYHAIPSGEFHNWLAVTESGEAIACSGVVVDQHPSGPTNLSGLTGYIMSVF